MTEDDARKVLTIMVSADSYCGVCAGNLFERFAAAYPEFAGMTFEIMDRQPQIRDAERAALDDAEERQGA